MKQLEAAYDNYEYRNNRYLVKKMYKYFGKSWRQGYPSSKDKQISSDDPCLSTQRSVLLQIFYDLLSGGKALDWELLTDPGSSGS